MLGQVEMCKEAHLEDCTCRGFLNKHEGIGALWARKHEKPGPLCHRVLLGYDPSGH